LQPDPLTSATWAGFGGHRIFGPTRPDAKSLPAPCEREKGNPLNTNDIAQSLREERKQYTDEAKKILSDAERRGVPT
jgi:hypothetical protein